MERKAEWSCGDLSQSVGSRFGAQQSIQDVARVSGAGGDETVALQKEAVPCGAPLPALAHAQGLEQPAPGPSSVSVQEDLADQEAAPWHKGVKGATRAFTLKQLRKWKWQFSHPFPMKRNDEDWVGGGAEFA